MTTRASTLSELKETVALAHRILFLTGLATAAGHASARIPGTDRFLIKPWPHVYMSRVRAEDIITMDLDGNIVQGKKPNITRVSEWPLHAEIYRANPNVGAVVHTHQQWATIMGIAGKTILPVHHPGQASVVAEPLPVYDEDFATVHTVEQGRQVARVLGNAFACQLRTHGLVFAAPNLQFAIRAAIDLEWEAELHWRAMLIGTPQPIPMLFMREAWQQRHSGIQTRPEPWNYYTWVDKHPEEARFRVVQL